MAKNKNYVGAILGLIICLCFSTTRTLADDIECVKRTYTGELGVVEATGHNDGPRVEEYLHSVGRYKGDAWCAAFVHWVLQKCGVSNIPYSGYSPSWFPSKYVVYKRGRANNKTPQTADVFGLYFQNMGRVAHVGFIDSWPTDSKYAITVEGNTSDANTGNATREGGKTCLKRRLKSQIYIVSRWVR